MAKSGEACGRLPRFSLAGNEVTDCLFSSVSFHCNKLRVHCDLLDYMQNIDRADDEVVVHYTGSTAEGIYSQAGTSDSDIMVVPRQVRVVSELPVSHEVDNERYFTSRSDNLHPGYVHLIDESEGGVVLRSDSAKEILRNYLSKDYPEHGPAVCIEANCDLVLALPSYEWPEIAKEFTTRERVHNQPSPELIEKISQEGCLFVAVGHHKSTDPGKEWRLSFSLAEKLLIRSWNSALMKTYIAAKLLIKKNLSSEPTVVPSYFIKTAIFWLIERYPDTFWKSEEILTCIAAVLLELQSFAKSGRCPNYFVPQNNMMDHFTTDQLAEASERIQDILNDLPLAVSQSVEGGLYGDDCEVLCQLLKNSESSQFSETVKAYKEVFFLAAERLHMESFLLGPLKEHLFSKLQQGENIVRHAGKVLEDFSRIIQDKNLESAHTKIVYQAVGDICQLSSELQSQAESWYDKMAALKYPPALDDGGLLVNTCKVLLFSCRGENRKALELCAQVFESNALSNQDAISFACQESCLVHIGKFEADKFRVTDSNLAAALGSLTESLFDPITVLLYEAIRCERDPSTRQKYVNKFMDIENCCPFRGNHGLLKDLLARDGLVEQKDGAGQRKL